MCGYEGVFGHSVCVDFSPFVFPVFYVLGDACETGDFFDVFVYFLFIVLGEVVIVLGKDFVEYRGYGYVDGFSCFLLDVFKCGFSVGQFAAVGGTGFGVVAVSLGGEHAYTKDVPGKLHAGTSGEVDVENIVYFFPGEVDGVGLFEGGRELFVLGNDVFM